MSDIIKKAGRPPGAKNTKYGIRLGDLCEILHPNMIIPLSRDFVNFVKKANSSIELKTVTNDLTPAEENPKLETEKIDFSVIDFNEKE